MRTDLTGGSDKAPAGNRSEEAKQRFDAYAVRLLKLARDTLIVNMRFMDIAAARLPFTKKEGFSGAGNDGAHFYYDPVFLLKKYDRDSHFPARLYLHSILHCVFRHSFFIDKLDEAMWNLSCDIAVENMIMELALADFSLADDEIRKIRLKGLKKGVKNMTAEGIYRYFLVNPLAKSDEREFLELFTVDSHLYWKEPEVLALSEEEWRKINDRIRADLKTFSKNAGHAEELLKNLEEGAKEKVDYKRLLERFLVTGEELTVSDEEFDYIYYTYGLSHYGNMPLIEPLEFKNEKKIRDFAIVLDTSASCRGDIIRGFLERTYDILKNAESFFRKFNVHIIQCDNEVQQDTKIESQADFDAFLKRGKLIGYGGTDFRPVFSYLDRLLEEGEFTNFKGLIYFTDGYGIYPNTAPDYDCIFAFMAEDNRKPEVPWWAVPVVFGEEDFL